MFQSNERLVVKAIGHAKVVMDNQVAGLDAQGFLVACNSTLVVIKRLLNVTEQVE